ncbi:PR domain zinc finger protein 5 [Blomia tropicalis]|nr:PR domain zinc finger protein 5 [Blomia tropicalis]
MHRCNRFQDNTTRKSSEDMDSIEQCIGYTYNRNCDEQSKSVESLKEQDEESDNDQLVIDEVPNQSDLSPSSTTSTFTNYSVSYLDEHLPRIRRLATPSSPSSSTLSNVVVATSFDHRSFTVGAQDSRSGVCFRVKTFCLKCPDCGTYVSNKSDLNQHRGDQHRTMPFVCCADGCGKRFEQSVHLTLHTRYHHRISSSDRINTESSWSCPSCIKSFTANRYLTNHIWKYHEIGVFACPNVGCYFKLIDATRNDIQNHINEEHTKKQVCSFPDCGKTMKSRYYLEIHEANHFKYLNRMNRITTIYTLGQVTEMERVYLSGQRYLHYLTRKDLAHRLGLTECSIEAWFEDRRSKEPRKRPSSAYSPDQSQSPDSNSPIFQHSNNQQMFGSSVQTQPTFSISHVPGQILSHGMVDTGSTLNPLGFVVYRPLPSSSSNSEYINNGSVQQNKMLNYTNAMSNEISYEKEMFDKLNITKKSKLENSNSLVIELSDDEQPQVMENAVIEMKDKSITNNINLKQSLPPNNPNLTSTFSYVIDEELLSDISEADGSIDSKTIFKCSQTKQQENLFDNNVVLDLSLKKNKSKGNENSYEKKALESNRYTNPDSTESSMIIIV